jgi:hypothetical protein
MHRRPVTLGVSLVTFTLALLGAAWAAAGFLPGVTATSPAGAPRVTAVDATRPLIANDSEGVAVLSAGDLAPGEIRAGEVTIGNAGGSAGEFTLTSGAAGSPLLAEVLHIRVLDVTGAEPKTLFSGALAALGRVRLGRFSPGTRRRYRFELAFPTGRSAELDDPLQGASTAVTFTWGAVASDEHSGTVPLPADSAPSPGSAPADPGPEAAPAGVVPDSAVLRLRLTRAPGPIRGGALVTRLSSTMPARVLLTGTITVGGRRMPLRTMRVRLANTRTVVRVPFPRLALARGAGRQATLRLSLTADAGSRRATMRRTLRVTLPRHAPTR